MRKGFATILIIVVGILLLLTTVGLTFLLIKPKTEVQRSTSLPQKTTTQSPEPQSEVQDQDGPKTAINSFLVAAKTVNKSTAKTFISPNANKEAFRSLLVDQYKGASIYDKDYTFEITDVRVDGNQVSAEVKVKITVGGQSLPIEYLLGRENGRWNLLDEWVLVSTAQEVPANFIDLLNNPSPSITFSRAVIRTDGPVHFSIYSPLYGDVGFGTNSTLQSVGAIYSGQDSVPQTISIQLSGVWVMKVTGSSSGEFSIITEIVDPTNHQVGTFKNTIQANEVKYFSVTNPSDLGASISVTPLN